MNVAVIGSGDVGQALAKALADLGHKVMIGTRNTSKKDLKWTKTTNEISVGSFAEAAEFGEMAFLAVAWHAAENVLSIIRPQVSGKIVVDVTNPIIFSDDDAPQLSIGFNISAGELVQQTLADSHVVKALNTIHYKNMYKPNFSNGVPTMFICGNNSAAKSQVEKLLATFGWSDVQDIGGIEKSRLLEPLCMLWIDYGVANDTWMHAFSVVRS